LDRGVKSVEDLLLRRNHPRRLSRARASIPATIERPMTVGDFREGDGDSELEEVGVEIGIEVGVGIRVEVVVTVTVEAPEIAL
jgi:hypothetical protein